MRKKKPSHSSHVRGAKVREPYHSLLVDVEAELEVAAGWKASASEHARYLSPLTALSRCCLQSELDGRLFDLAEGDT